ncbi:thiaminase II [Pediococcus claussenii]|uniref:Aminopyrimidine aminohydrolase n=1 Tax=Pediococcus claussenii (strain ATCC BAA-344 / DSM 14800 / JCM 18046 / KCTC 3811 / LMG 21948 / P06) TaxID=701521 RepID=G8PAI4_PEDCP|nr:thiaminase II [Pediococcus claussenii]AEV95773.1 TENA/THI-4/PQQC family protein [Pediococcus claussenii ATCC BAA-344]ANZ69278.1 thiaminase II [Pediococcus claussenii]ANZ71097.1 thiaminase II [Pediococcus claussenii]KRN20383.1 hypothetical protein IV79_GL000436 [Pediococcus claussenii]
MFSERLKNNATGILNRIENHPFVTGIAAGKVPNKALVFYVEQDFNYLTAFAKVYAGAIQKCASRDDMRFFYQQLGFTLDDEVLAHQIFCDVAGEKYEEHQRADQAPMTYLYNEHMYNAMRTGDLIDVLAALAPCPWTYNEIGKKMISENANSTLNPFKNWIEFYGEDDSVEQMFTMIDREAGKYSDEELDQVEQRFLKSCELEWEFWEQAFYQKDWHFKNSN